MSDGSLPSYGMVKDVLEFDEFFFRKQLEGTHGNRFTAKSLNKWAVTVAPALSTFKKDFLEDSQWYTKLSHRIGPSPSDWITHVPSIAEVCRQQQKGEDVSSRSPVTVRLATVVQEICKIKLPPGDDDSTKDFKMCARYVKCLSLIFSSIMDLQNRPTGFFMRLLKGGKLEKWSNLTMTSGPGHKNVEERARGRGNVQQQNEQAAQIRGTKRRQDEATDNTIDQNSDNHAAKKVRVEQAPEESSIVASMMQRIEQLEKKVNELSDENKELKARIEQQSDGMSQETSDHINVLYFQAEQAKHWIDGLGDVWIEQSDQIKDHHGKIMRLVDHFDEIKGDQQKLTEEIDKVKKGMKEGDWTTSVSLDEERAKCLAEMVVNFLEKRKESSQE